MKSDSHWAPIGLRPHHGICLPLFSLHAGTFLHLIPLIDWCRRLHLDCLQLLPLNDTGHDPSPYNPLSSCALDPIYLDVPIQKALTSRQDILDHKLAAMRERFHPAFLTTDAYQAFLADHPWLDDYARFKALKEANGHRHWKDWSIHSPPSEKVDFYRFLQFHCFAQMQKVREHATKQGLFLLGDMPILLSPDSADVWAHPELFSLERVAGAPPDTYNPLGQKWGFPLLRWEKSNRWWAQRLKTLEKLYHLYRIDHVVGFFRIWGIGADQPPSAGAFYPTDPSLWEAQGRKHLEMLLSTSPLLPIAEDLGTIPPCVYTTLKELGICGTKVIRWQRDEGAYRPYDQYEPLSLTTLSTPDLPILPAWWRDRPDESVPFAQFKKWPYHPVLSFEQHLELLRDAHHTSSYFHINQLQEYLALFPELTWQKNEEGRINVPGTRLPSNWAYRFRPSLEEIIAHKGLATMMDKILN